MARNKDDDSGREGRGRKEEKEPEEEVAEEVEEGGERAKAVSGNSFAAESAGASGASGVGRAEEQAYQRGNPGEDDGDGGGSAGAPTEDGDLDVVLFGDADWTPPPPIVSNAPRATPWVDDPVADWRVRRARLARMVELSAEAGGLDALGVRVPPAVVRDAAVPWAAAAAKWLDPDGVGGAVAWWLETGTASLTGSGGRLRRGVRSLAVGALALRALTVPEAPEPHHLGPLLGLAALTGRLDRAEQQTAGQRTGLVSAAELVSEALAPAGEPIEPPMELEPSATTRATFEAVLALRPAGRWGDPGPLPPGTSADGLVQRRRQLSDLGVSLFRELLRQRVRVAGAVSLLADLAESTLGASTHAGLQSLCREVDRHTLGALDVLRTLGRGVSRPPYRNDEELRALLADVVQRADTVRGGLVWEVGSWFELIAGGPVVEPPRRNSASLRALRAGRGDRSGLVGVDAAFLPDAEPKAMLEAWEALRAEGRGELAGVMNALAGPVLLAAGRLADAQYLAEAGIALGFELSCPALVADASLRAADALAAGGQAEAAAEVLVDLGSVLVAAEGPAWGELLSGWIA